MNISDPMATNEQRADGLLALAEKSNDERAAAAFAQAAATHSLCAVLERAIATFGYLFAEKGAATRGR